MGAAEHKAITWRRSLQTRVTVGILVGMLGLIAIALAILYWRGYAVLAERERAQAAGSTLRLAGEVGQQLALIEGLAAAMANLAERLPRDRALWHRVYSGLLDLEQREELIAGGGIWPEPDAFEPGVQRASFFWGRDAAGQLRYFEDYNRPEGPGYHAEEWYVPVRHQRPGHCYWSRSYRDPYTAEPMVTCAVGMHAAGDFIGASTVDLRLADLQRFVAERGRSLGGYAMMIDRNGTFIAWPEQAASITVNGNGPPTLVQLASGWPGLAPLAEFVERIPPTTDQRAIKLAAQLRGRDIDADEALRIARQLLAPSSDGGAVRQAVFDADPFLAEPVLATVAKLDGTHWQLVVVQPRRRVQQAVEAILTPLALSLTVAIALVVLLAAFLVRRSLVDPIRLMASAVLQADPQAQRAPQLPQDRDDELGLLARRFNDYGLRLAHSHTQLEASAEQLRSVTALAHDALLQVDEGGVIRAANPAAGRIFGCPPEALQGRPLDELLPWSEVRQLVSEADAGAGADSLAAARIRVMEARRGESRFPAEVTAGYWRGPQGGLYHVQVRDITERRRNEERVRQLATQDTLTGLANRVLFQDRLAQGIKQCQRTRRLLGLLYLDLDHFKLANDSLGHAVGDALLRAVSERLLACVGGEGSVARLGGDEFAVLLPSLVEAAEAGEMAARIIGALEPAFVIDGHVLQIGVSIGVILSPNDGVDPDQLLRKADLAMYHAKAQGRNTYRFFTERLRTELLARTALLSDLKQAIMGEQFLLHYQPIVATRSGAVHGVEALLRWQHPQRGLITPDSFVTLAERSGLIVPIGQWVIDRALAQLAQLDQPLRNGPPLRLAVNLSLAQLVDPALVDWLESRLLAHQVEPHRLELELTETALLHDLEHGVEVLQRLKALGVGLVIDDFGIGQSSLAYLKRFPVEKLKIDRSFVIGVAQDRDNAAICRAVVGMGRSLGLLLVAEGVENPGDLDFVREQGFDYAQGFHFSRPLALDELQDWLQRRREVAPA